MRIKSTHFLLSFFLVTAAGLAQANPSNPTVVSGTVSFDSSVAGTLDVYNSPGSIINWQDFSIGVDEITRFIQESNASTVLNRVTGGNLSQILGQLQSNGHVFLVNPAGILVGPQALIDAGSFTAGTLDLSDHDFLTGNFHFTAADAMGAILNQGMIRAGANGDILLIAPDITNEGTITSDGGSITLAAGQAMLLTDLDTPEIQFELQSAEDTVLNLGTLSSAGGAIDIFAGTIEQRGLVSVSSASLDGAGNIRLMASGDTMQYGTTEAIGANGNGGEIQLLGDRVGVMDGAVVDASGATGGGEVYVGGSQEGQGPLPNASAVAIQSEAIVRANALENGDGGTVIAFSDDFARIVGTLEARGGALGGDGGFIETSGLKTLELGVDPPDVGAPAGNGGTWLIDPSDIDIVNIEDASSYDQTATSPPPSVFEPNGTQSVATIGIGTIRTALSSGNVTVKTNTSGTGEGDITLAAPLTVDGTMAGRTLLLESVDDIFIDIGKDGGAGSQAAFTNNTGGTFTFNMRAADDIIIYDPFVLGTGTATHIGLQALDGNATPEPGLLNGVNLLASLALGTGSLSNDDFFVGQTGEVFNFLSGTDSINALEVSFENLNIAGGSLTITATSTDDSFIVDDTLTVSGGTTHTLQGAFLLNHITHSAGSTVLRSYSGVQPSFNTNALINVSGGTLDFSNLGGFLSFDVDNIQQSGGIITFSPVVGLLLDIDSLLLSGGTFEIPSTGGDPEVDVLQTFNWSGGTIRGLGTQSQFRTMGALSKLTGDTTKTLDGVVWTNAGDAEWDAGDLQWLNGGKIQQEEGCPDGCIVATTFNITGTNDPNGQMTLSSDSSPNPGQFTIRNLDDGVTSSLVINLQSDTDRLTLQNIEIVNTDTMNMQRGELALASKSLITNLKFAPTSTSLPVLNLSGDVSGTEDHPLKLIGDNPSEDFIANTSESTVNINTDVTFDGVTLNNGGNSTVNWSGGNLTFSNSAEISSVQSPGKGFGTVASADFIITATNEPGTSMTLRGTDGSQTLFNTNDLLSVDLNGKTLILDNVELRNSAYNGSPSRTPTLFLDDGTITLNNNAFITNQAGSGFGPVPLLYFRGGDGGSATVTGDGDGTGRIDNAGAVDVDNTSSIDDVAFNNTGSINIDGSLSLGAGGTAGGSFTLAGGGTLTFNDILSTDAYDLNGSDITGTGSVAVIGSTLVNNATADTATVSTGSVVTVRKSAGGNNAQIGSGATQPFDFQDGLDLDDSVTAAPVTTMNGAISTTTLVNDASGTLNILGTSTLTASGAISNSGLIDLQGDVNVNASNYSNLLTGSELRKSAGTGTSTLTISSGFLSNSGKINVTSGKLVTPGFSLFSGASIALANGATLEITDSLSHTAGTISGAGTLNVINSIFNTNTSGNSALAINANGGGLLTINAGGSIEANTVTADTGSSLDMDAGGTGNINITTSATLNGNTDFDTVDGNISLASMTAKNNAMVAITAGNAGDISIPVFTSEGATINLTGGNFSATGSLTLGQFAEDPATDLNLNLTGTVSANNFYWGESTFDNVGTGTLTLTTTGNITLQSGLAKTLSNTHWINDGFAQWKNGASLTLADGSDITNNSTFQVDLRTSQPTRRIVFPTPPVSLPRTLSGSGSGAETFTNNGFVVLNDTITFTGLNYIEGTTFVEAVLQVNAGTTTLDNATLSIPIEVDSGTLVLDNSSNAITLASTVDLTTRGTLSIIGDVLQVDGTLITSPDSTGSLSIDQGGGLTTDGIGTNVFAIPVTLNDGSITSDQLGDPAPDYRFSGGFSATTTPTGPGGSINADIEASTLTLSTGTLMEIAGGQTTITGGGRSGSQVAAGAELRVASGGTLDMAGVMVLDGTLTIDGGAFQDNQLDMTISGSGVLSMHANSTYTYAAGGTSGGITNGGLVEITSDSLDLQVGSFTNQSGGIVRKTAGSGSGTSTITTVNSVFSNEGDVEINNGTLRFENQAGTTDYSQTATGTTTLSSGLETAGDINALGTFSGSGTITSTGGSITLQNLDATTGTFNVSAPGNITINGATTGDSVDLSSTAGNISTTTVSTTNNTTLGSTAGTVSSGNITSASGAISVNAAGNINTGNISGATNTTLTSSGGTVTTGDLASSGGAVSVSGATGITAGDVIASTDTSLNGGTGSVTTADLNSGTGTLTVAGTQFNVAALDLSGGNLDLSGVNTVNANTVTTSSNIAISNTLTTTGGLTQSGGTLNLSGGTIVGNVNVTGGTFKGNAARVTGNLTIGGGATLAPGASPGTLNVGGSLTLGPSSMTIFEIFGFSQGVNYDLINVGANLNVDPNAQAQLNFGGFTPPFGTPFTLITYAGLGTVPSSFGVFSTPFVAVQQFNPGAFVAQVGGVTTAPTPTAQTEVLVLADNTGAGGTELSGDGAQEVPEGESGGETNEEGDGFLSDISDFENTILMCE